MTTDQIVLLVVCGVLAISSVLTGVLVYRQSGHKPHLFAGIGWALMAIALYVSGLAALLWQAIQSILVWASGLATNVVGGVGLALLAVGALMVVISRFSTRRSKAKLAARRTSTPSSVPRTTAQPQVSGPPSGSAPDASPSLARRLGRVTRSLQEQPTDSEPPSLARRLGRMTRTIREGEPAPTAPTATARPSRPTPSAAPPSRPSRPLLDMGEPWNTLDLETPATAPAPTAAGAPLPVSPTSGAASSGSGTGAADDQVQRFESSPRPPQD